MKETAYIYNIKILRSDIYRERETIQSYSHLFGLFFFFFFTKKKKTKQTQVCLDPQIVCDTLVHTTLFDSFRFFFHLGPYLAIKHVLLSLFLRSPFSEMSESPLFLSLGLLFCKVFFLFFHFYFNDRSKRHIALYMNTQINL